MTVSRFKAILPGDVQTVWDIVTGVMEYPAWRSDVERVETPGAQTFWEYAKGGYVTKFTITGEEDCRRWTLAMENANLTGRWVGVFRQRGAATAVDFTEYVTVKKFWMRPLVKLYLQRQQAQFAQLFSRIRMQREYTTRKVKQEDVNKLFPVLASRGAQKELDFLLGVCRSPWGIRGAVNLYSNAASAEDISYDNLYRMAAHMGIGMLAHV